MEKCLGKIPREQLQNKRWFPPTFDLDLLLDYALSIAQQTVDCKAAFVSGSSLGWYSFILFISFDGCHEDLVLKSPVKYVDGLTDLRMESEASTIRLVESKTQIPVTHVYRYESEISGNPVKWPYILMSKAKGVPLCWECIPIEGRETVMKDLAKCLCQLSQLTFGEIGSIVSSGDEFITTRSVHLSFSGNAAGPFQSAKDYYTYQLALFYEDVCTDGEGSRVPFLREIPHREDFDSPDAFSAASDEYWDVNKYGHEHWNTPQNIARYVRLHHEMKDAMKDLFELESHEFVLAHPDL